MSSKLVRCALAAALTITAIGCGEEVVKVPPSVTLTLGPDTILNDGEAFTTVSITAKDDVGQPGTGTVVLAAQAGDFAGSDKPARALITLNEGLGEATFTCNRAKYPACSGKVTLTATFGDAIATAVVNLTDVSPADITITPARETLLAVIGDDATRVTVSVRRDGKPLRTRILAKVDKGAFKNGQGSTISLDTDADGLAEVEYQVNKADPGEATLTVEAADVKKERKLVLAPPKLSVAFDRPELYAGANDRLKATVTVTDAAGTPVAAVARVRLTTEKGRFASNSAKALPGATGFVETTSAGTYEAFLEYDPAAPTEDGASKVVGTVLNLSAAALGTGEATFNIKKATPTLLLDNNKTTLYSAVGDSTTVVVKLQDANDVTRALARADVPVTLEITPPANGTTAARLAWTDSGGTTHAGQKITVQTNASGEARVALTAPLAEAQTVKVTSSTLGGKPASVDVILKKVTLELTRTGTSPLVGSVGDSDTVTLRLRDGTAALPFRDVEVLFDLGTTPLGTLRDSGNTPLGARATLKTDASGEIRLVYVASVNVSSPATATLTASAASVTASLPIAIAPLLVELTAANGRTRVFNGLSDKLTLRAQLKGNGQNRAQPGVAVTFRLAGNPQGTTHGLLDSAGQLQKEVSVVTDGTGLATATFAAHAADSVATRSVEAVLSSGYVSTPALALTIARPRIDLVAADSSLATAVGNTTALTARITDEGTPIDGLPLDGVGITFARTTTNTGAGLVSSSGSVLNSLQVTTSAQGVATATFATGVAAGTATVTASAPGMQQGSTSITLREVSVQLTFATNNTAYNGIGDTLEIIGQVRAADGSSGQPVQKAGIPVTFETNEHQFDNGSRTIELLTDANGRVRARFTPSVAQLSVATAKVGAWVTPTNKTPNPVGVDVTVKTVTLAISASPSSVNSGSSDTSTITIELKDGSNLVPRAGVALNLDTTVGSLTSGTATGAAIQVSTDGSGKATATFSPGSDTTASSARVTVKRSPLTDAFTTITLVPTTVELTSNATKIYRNVGAEYLMRAQVLPLDRIRGVETG
ncbi:MAG: hypothetical protein ACK4N5_01755, partial [Myxococcales bacterium]